jgi:hypothetical protein
VEFDLNEDYSAYRKVLDTKKLTENTTKEFNERYQMPICLGLFQIAMEKEGIVPDDYVKREQNRMAQVLISGMEPDIKISMQSGFGNDDEVKKDSTNKVSCEKRIPACTVD